MRTRPSCKSWALLTLLVALPPFFLSGPSAAREKAKPVDWSKPTLRAGQTVTLSAKFAVPGGTEVLFKIREHDADGKHDDVATLHPVKVKDGKATVTWKVKYVADVDDVLTAQEKDWRVRGFKQWSSPELFFDASVSGAGHSVKTSPVAKANDRVSGAIGSKRAGVRVRLIFDGGVLQTITKSGGHYSFANVPPGPYKFSVPGK